MKLKPKGAFNQRAFWRSVQKYKPQIESLHLKVSKAVEKGDCKNIFDMAVSAIELDLMDVSELLPMYPKAIIEMDDSIASDSIRMTIVCEERPMQVLELLRSRVIKAKKVIDAGRPAAFTPLAKDKIPNGFMGWRMFVVG